MVCLSAYGYVPNNPTVYLIDFYDFQNLSLLFLFMIFIVLNKV